MRSARISATKVDIVLRDEEFSLVPFGIPGKVLYTPGHTMGSVSVLLETGDACVGDLAMNGFPFHLRPGLPVFAEDLELVKKSWRLLLDQGAKIIYPGHGKPFPADIIRRSLLWRYVYCTQNGLLILVLPYDFWRRYLDSRVVLALMWRDEKQECLGFAG